MKKDKDKVSNEVIEKNTKKAKKDMFEEYIPYLIIIFFVIIIRTFIATPVRVDGTSMNPTLKDGDVMVLYKLVKHTRGLKRFDIVVVNTGKTRLIKRIVGLPGERIKYEITPDENGNQVGRLLINGEVVEENFIKENYKSQTCNNNWNICNEELTIPMDKYFVMGDNRGNSMDSRVIGPVSRDEITGTTKLTIFPFTRLGNKE